MGRRNAAGLNDPVNESQGGTAASTFDQARTNLGVNPTFTALTLTYNAVAADRGKYFHYTGAGGVDFTLTAAATLTSTWSCFLRNDAAANITINPDGGELINGAATLAIEPGVCVEIFCSGTEFFTLGQATAVDGANTTLSNLGTTSINAALLPSADNTRDLGTNALGWRNIYTRTVVSPVTGGLALAVWDTGTNTYKAILGGVVANPPTAVIADFVTGTTQAPATNTDQLATCAFVLANSGTGTVTSVSGTAGRVTSTGGATPAIDIDATYVGQTSITTLGTIATGVWNGTDIAVDAGGSGRGTADAYAVICGGTTSTNPHQSVASVGSAGQVLTSNGAGALPTFQSNPAGAGALVFIASVTASASATVDFSNNLSSTYDHYYLTMQNVLPATDAVSFSARVGTGAGPTYQATNYVGQLLNAVASFANGSASSTDRIDLINGSASYKMSNTALITCAGDLLISNVNDATNYKNIKAHLGYSAKNPGWAVSCPTGQWQGATVLTSVRFLMSSGNVASGVFKLYGIKNS